MLRHIHLKLYLLLIFCLFIRTEVYGISLEVRPGVAFLQTKMENEDVHSFFPVFCGDLILTWPAGPMESRLRINVSLGTTNTTYLFNNTISNSPYLADSKLLVRNYFLSFRESLPFHFFKKRLFISPHTELKIAHYTDLSAASEFINRTTDWIFSFLNIGLELSYREKSYEIRSSYNFPLFGYLTDKLLKENRCEDEFELSFRLKNKNGWISIGYNGFTLRYSVITKNGDGIPYHSKSHAMLFASIGINFK